MDNYNDLDRGDPTPYFEMGARPELAHDAEPEPTIPEHLGKALAILEGLMHADDLFLEAEEWSDLGKEENARETLEYANNIFNESMCAARALVFGFTHCWDGYLSTENSVVRATYNKEYAAIDEAAFKDGGPYD